MTPKTQTPEYFSPMTYDEMMAACRRIRHVALDMDGTIYMGSTLIPFTKDLLAKLTRLGIGYSFLTNNPTRSIADYLKKLAKLGIEATDEDMYTTAVATIEYLKARMPEVKRIFALGTPSMIREFEEAGFEMAACDANDRPDALIVAFDTTLQYDRLCHAAWLAQQGLPYIATNPDRVCPTNEETVLVDCGSICRCLESATGRKPDITLGKPDPNMLIGIQQQRGLKPEEILMVGDRIYTDIAMAFNAGAMGCLVLSGETTMEVAQAAERQPDLIVDSIEVLGNMLQQIHDR